MLISLISNAISIIYSDRYLVYNEVVFGCSSLLVVVIHLIYSRSLWQDSGLFKNKHPWWYIAPVAVFTIITLFVIFILPDSPMKTEGWQPMMLIRQYFGNLEKSRLFFLSATFLAGTILWSLYHAFRLFRLQPESTNTSRQPAYYNSTWQIMIWLGVQIFVISVFLMHFFENHNHIVHTIIYNSVVFFGSAMVGLFIMKQDALINEVLAISGKPIRVEENLAVTDNHSETTSGFEPRKKQIPDEDALKIRDDILQLMEQTKPYLNPDYSLNELAAQLQLKSKIVSYVINDLMGKNFHGLINEYRVEESIMLLKNHSRQLKIDAVAGMAGFRSKSSFYVCFRQYTGRLPKELVDEARNDT